MVRVGGRVGEQLVTEDREEIDGPLGGVGLRTVDVAGAGREVEVAPAEVERLAKTEAGECSARSGYARFGIASADAAGNVASSTLAVRPTVPRHCLPAPHTPGQG
jgi:hypothetical protein